MSLCLVLQTKNLIFISGDSRESIKDNGVHSATGRQVRKIHRVGNQVIFHAGSGLISEAVIEEYSASTIRTVHNLRIIAKKHTEKFIRQYGPDYLGNTHHIDLFVACFENGKSVLYGISSSLNFKIERRVGTDQARWACAGVHVNEALEIYEQSAGKMDVIEMYKHLYKSLESEQMGGTLTLFILDNSGRIKENHYPISEKVLHNADTFSMQVGDGSGTNWVDAVYFDTVAGVYKFNGTLEAVDGVFSGNLSAVGGTFTGELQGGTIAIGSANDIFKADSNGIYLGHATFASAPFRVNMDRDLTATNATITGTINATGGTFSGSIAASGTITGGTISGAAISGGTINVATDVFIGNILHLNASSSSGKRGIEFHNPSASSSTINVISGDMSIFNPGYLLLNALGGTNVSGSFIANGGISVGITVMGGDGVTPIDLTFTNGMLSSIT